MALADRIKVTTSTTGTGAITLSATGVRDATNGDCLAPAEVLAKLGGRTVPYFVTSGANWAEGNGWLSANGLTLTRDAREERWNGTTLAVGLLSLTGTSTIIITPRAEDLMASSIGISIAIRSGAFHF